MLTFSLSLSPFFTEGLIFEVEFRYFTERWDVEIIYCWTKLTEFELLMF